MDWNKVEVMIDLLTQTLSDREVPGLTMDEWILVFGRLIAATGAARARKGFDD